MSAERSAWSWRHAIIKSDLPSTTRLVLLTLSCFMNEMGEGCYPTTAQLADATGLSERAVCTHIEKAAQVGWLVKSQHGFRGQKWRNNSYEAAFPDAENQGKESGENEPENAQKGTERGSAASQKVLNVVPKGTEPDDKKVLNEVQCNSPYTNPINRERDAREAATDREPEVGQPSGHRQFGNPAITLQSVLDPFTAKRFADHCAEKGRRLSTASAESLVSVLRAWTGEGGKVGEAIDLAIRRGWTSIELDWLRNGLNPKPDQLYPRGSPPNRHFGQAQPKRKKSSALQFLTDLEQEMERGGRSEDRQGGWQSEWKSNRAELEEYPVVAGRISGSRNA